MKRTEGLSFDEIYELLSEAFGKTNFLKKSTFLKYYRSESSGGDRASKSRHGKSSRHSTRVNPEEAEPETDNRPEAERDADPTAARVDLGDAIPERERSPKDSKSSKLAANGSAPPNDIEREASATHTHDAAPSITDLPSELNDAGSASGTASANEHGGDGNGRGTETTARSRTPEAAKNSAPTDRRGNAEQHPIGHAKDQE